MGYYCPFKYTVCVECGSLERIILFVVVVLYIYGVFKGHVYGLLCEHLYCKMLFTSPSHLVIMLYVTHSYVLDGDFSFFSVRTSHLMLIT